MMASQDLIQNTIEIIDTAHSYRMQLSQLLDTLTELEDQVCSSGSKAVQLLTAHFSGLKAAVCETLDKRLQQLLGDLECMKEAALKPLRECRTFIGKNIETASQVMEEGRTIMAADPENNMEKVLKFRDSPQAKGLVSVPEVPSPSDVAYFTVETNPNLIEQLKSLVMEEGKVVPRPPVQIVHADEKPGGVQVLWAETEEEGDLGEFMLQYACGKADGKDDTRLLFHTVYEGSSTCYTVKNLRINTPYSFRVRGRVDKNSAWSSWCLPYVKSTSIPHHRWGDGGEAYSLSNEGRTATRTGEGMTRVLYSVTDSYVAGDALNLRILDSADVSPGDGLAIVCDDSDENSCNRTGAIFVNTYGNVFVDGQEMKTKLPSIKKGTTLTFETEPLPNGKVRVSVQVDDKEVTLDWKVTSQNTISEGSKQPSVPSFFFALRFAQEDWKIGVE